MRTDLRRRELLRVLLFAVVTTAILLVLVARFGGPSVRLDEPFGLTAAVPDAQGLPVRADVRVRGVRVGTVRDIERDGARARVRLDVTGDGVVVRRGATLRVGTKSLLGEPYLDLDPGPRGAAPLPSGSRVPVREAVELDEALDALGPAARDDLRAVVREAGDGAASPDAAAQVGAAAGELRGAVGELRRLGDVLAGQAADVEGAVRAGGLVAGELAGRDAAVRALVRDGRRALEAAAGGDDALRAAVRELPRTLTTAEGALADARPLLREARPVAGGLAAAAPATTAALRELPDAARDLRAVLARAGAVRRALAPVLRDAGPAIAALRPASRGLEPALRNVVPVVRFLSERRRTVAAWFSNTAALGKNRDAKGHYARFFIGIDPGTVVGGPSTLPGNAYTGPDDAAANRPYRAGDFPRLTPEPVR